MKKFHDEYYIPPVKKIEVVEVITIPIAKFMIQKPCPDCNKLADYEMNSGEFDCKTCKEK